jgi:hypothetical protein
MSKDEIKQEINKVLDRFSDKALQDLLSFLKGVENAPTISLFQGDNFRKVLSEDKELLAKLAQ